MAWKPDICIHHFPCDDGFAAAWIVKRRWPDVTLAGTNYGLSFPDVDITGKNVLIADFSYKRDELADLAKRARSIIVLDHHKTAQAELAPDGYSLTFAALREINQPGAFAHFDMERSGAALTWEFCFPDEPMPEFIRFIEDRDLWRFSLRNTRPFSLYLRSVPMTLKSWDDIAREWAYEPENVMAKAYAIERFYDQKLAEMVPTAMLKSIGKWKDVPVAHAPYSFASDLAHELLKAHPAAPFAAVVVDAYGGRTYSLRSDDSREDVSAVAKTFGGGGHRNAAGFRVPA